MITKVETGIAPSKAPVTGTVRAGMMVFSAHIPKDPETGTPVTGDIETQTRQLLSNLDRALIAAGVARSDVAMVQIFLVDRADGATVNTLYRDFFAEPYPCRATVVVKELMSPGVRIEMIVTAMASSVADA